MKKRSFKPICSIGRRSPPEGRPVMLEEKKNKAAQDELEDLYRKVAQDDVSREEARQSVDLSPC
jgi:hypothetical protein